MFWGNLFNFKTHLILSFAFQILEKLKYARWKAADILRAIKEGVQPTSGPATKDQSYLNQDMDESLSQDTLSQDPAIDTGK